MGVVSIVCYGNFDGKVNGKLFSQELADTFSDLFIKKRYAEKRYSGSILNK